MTTKSRAYPCDPYNNTALAGATVDASRNFDGSVSSTLVEASEGALNVNARL